MPGRAVLDMGLMNPGSTANKKGAIIASCFFAPISGFTPKNWFLAVDTSFFSTPETYKTYFFSTTALKKFTLQFDTVRDYKSNWTGIFPIEQGSVTTENKIVAGQTYVFEKGKTYVFSYGWTGSENGYAAAAGKLV